MWDLHVPWSCQPHRHDSSVCSLGLRVLQLQLHCVLTLAFYLLSMSSDHSISSQPKALSNQSYLLITSITRKNSTTYLYLRKDQLELGKPWWQLIVNYGETHCLWEKPGRGPWDWEPAQVSSGETAPGLYYQESLWLDIPRPLQNTPSSLEELGGYLTPA